MTFPTSENSGNHRKASGIYNGIVEVTGSIPVGSTKQPAAVSRPFATWATAAAPPAGKALPRGGFRRFAILARMGGETPYAARLFPFPCGAAFFARGRLPDRVAGSDWSISANPPSRRRPCGRRRSRRGSTRATWLIALTSCPCVRVRPAGLCQRASLVRPR